jgi:hypothetical protein
LRGDARPVHIGEADTLEPQRVGPDLETEREQRKQRDDGKRDEGDDDRAAGAPEPVAKAAAIVRAATRGSA